MNSRVWLLALVVGLAGAGVGIWQLSAQTPQPNDVADWAEEANQCLPQLTAWDQQAMWDHVLAANPRITISTQLFVRTWLAAVTDTSAMSAATDTPLRALVESREVKIKKAAQSRLLNPRLLAAWSGDSGAGRLAYRWRQVRRMTTDLHDGLAR